MANDEDGFSTCDYCGGTEGEFFVETGNHPVCEELAKLKDENEQLFQVANRAMACVLNMPINESSAPEIIELDRYMAHEISEELNERLDGCIAEKKQP